VVAYRLVYLASVVLLLVDLVVGFVAVPLVFWPWFWLLFFVVVALWGFVCEGKHGWAWFLPVVLWLLVLWWGAVTGKVLPYLATLDYSRLGVDAGKQLLRARVGLLVVSLVPVVGYVYVFRDGVAGILRSVLGVTLDFSRFSLRSPGGFLKELLAESKSERKLVSLGFGKPTEDVVICHTESGEPVTLSDKDRYLHMLVVGPTGAGKTSRILKPLIEQEMRNIRSSLVRGNPRGMTVVEPKGDLAADVAEMARFYRVPVVYIDPLRPDSCRFNPLEGDPAMVAEATRTVLNATFGEQQAFFGLVQELAARNIVLLLKYRRRNDVTMHHMSRLLRDHSLLREEVNGLRELMDNLEHRIARAEAAGDRRGLEWFLYLRRVRPRVEDLLTYFEVEVLGERMSEKMQQFALGLRLQVDNLTGNEYLGPIIGGRSDINLDAHLNRGGVLVVNTAMGELGKLGDAFGQFLIMHFQNAVFRRKGNEHTRARHMLIMDEAHRYINPDFERLLAMGRSYCCECVLALQNTAQLLLDEKRSFRDSVLNLCRNKVVFGGMDSEEAKYFAREFGETLEKDVQVQHDATLLFGRPWSGRKYRVSEKYKQRFDYTALMELPAFHVVYRLVKDSAPQAPGVGVTRLSDWDERYRGRVKVSPGLSITVPDDIELPSGHMTTEVRL
jgi:hypothetical protein